MTPRPEGTFPLPFRYGNLSDLRGEKQGKRHVANLVLQLLDPVERTANPLQTNAFFEVREENTPKIVLDGTQSGVPSLSIPVGFFGTLNWRGAGHFHARLLACGPRTLLAV